LGIQGYSVQVPKKIQTNKEKVMRCNLATEAARQFFSTLSVSTEKDLSSIHHAVQLDPTIMTIGVQAQ
jgi:hypothetical protein